MAAKRQADMRIGHRRDSDWRKGNIKKITIKGESDKQREVTVRCETALQREERSTFNWLEEFTMEWSETFISKNWKRVHRRGENR